MQRGLIFCKEWSSIYRHENPTVTGGDPEGPRYIWGRQAYKGAARSRIGVKKTCNNNKSLSEIQLEYEKEDEFVVVVGLYDGGEGDYIDDEEEEDEEGEGGSEV
ncbi:hypothetical protein Tco_0417991 [Tanacetum coccineum]